MATFANGKVNEANFEKLFRASINSLSYLEKEERPAPQFLRFFNWFFDRSYAIEDLFVISTPIVIANSCIMINSLMNSLLYAIGEEDEVCFPIINGHPKIAFSSKACIITTYSDQIIEFLPSILDFIEAIDRIAISESRSIQAKLWYVFWADSYKKALQHTTSLIETAQGNSKKVIDFLMQDTTNPYSVFQDQEIAYWTEACIEGLSYVISKVCSEEICFLLVDGSPKIAFLEKDKRDSISTVELESLFLTKEDYKHRELLQRRDEIVGRVIPKNLGVSFLKDAEDFISTFYRLSIKRKEMYELRTGKPYTTND